MWDTGLDANTVTSIYNSGVPNNLTLAASYTAGGGTDKSGDLQGFWRMGEGSTWDSGAGEWTIPDDSANSNTGTTQGTAAMDRINNAPGNITSGLSDNMDVDDVVNNAPSNQEQGLSVSMDVEDRESHAPDNLNQANSVSMDETAPPDGRSTDTP